MAHRLGFEIAGNRERIEATLWLHANDVPVVGTAFAGQFERCRLMFAGQPLIETLSGSTWPDAQFLAPYPPLPYFHLLSTFEEFKTSPFESFLCALREIRPPAVGFYHCLFQPVQRQRNWHANVELLQDLEYGLKPQCSVGITKAEMAAWIPWFPANFIAETTATELPAIGAGGDLPTQLPRRRGRRTRPAQRVVRLRDVSPPVIFSPPVVTAKVGAEYRLPSTCQPILGDLTACMKDNQQISGYSDIEKPVFTLEQGPAWLKIDAATGLLSGKPDAAGQVEVVLTARIERTVRTLDEKTLAWGNEKVLAVSTELVVVATR